MSEPALTVPLPAGAYPIYIGTGLLEQNDLWMRHITGSQVAVVTNETVAALYEAPVQRALAEQAEQVDVLRLPDGEAYKTLAVYEQIMDFLIAHRHHRTTTVVALGGGVVGDLAGFAAATYQRGVNLVQVPTTLLAQVDSSVGGKTAVNHEGGKNLIGAFYQPSAVVADVSCLRSLPPRELRAGLAEVMKYGVIEDPEFFAFIEQHADALLAGDTALLGQAVRRSCEIKAAVVAEDEKEHGRRAILNFGHTFGHAIETVLGHGELLHGEAVGLGMVMAADFSWRIGRLPLADAQRIKALVAALGLPVTRPQGAKPALLTAAFEMDKKVIDGTLRFVLASAIGTVAVAGIEDRSTLTATLEASELCV